MIRKLIFGGNLVLLVLGALCAQPDASKGRTFAFLVACGDYDKTQLKPVPFTVNEMKLFRQVLIDTGVPDKNIVFLHDKAEPPIKFLPTRANILTQFKLLMERLRPDDSVIVAFSGHGVQFKGDQYGYFCPLDAELGVGTNDKLLPMEGKDGLLTLLDQGKAGRKLLIVNACRNNPTSGANLAADKLKFSDEYNEEAPKGTVMLLACSKNQFSWFYDDKEKREERRNRSLFMYHLTEAWKGSYAKGKKVTVDHLIAEVTERVEADAPGDFNRNQMPIVKRRFEGKWELATAAAVAVAKYVDVDLGSGVKMKMVYIAPGQFQMGSPKEEKQRSDNELPSDNEFQHDVELTKGFYLGVYAVTQEEYETVMGENRSYFSSDGRSKDKVAGMNTARFPVEYVSWDEAKEFCRKLSQKEGKTYRLPTEAEWEYACRAGTTTPFHCSETISTDQVNYDGNRPYGDGAKGEYRARTMKVGSFAANAWGLYDMHGNVWQWCEDCYDKDYYANSPRLNPLNTKEGSARMARGGSWNDAAWNCRSASRNWHGPSHRDDALGFRVARSSVE